MSSSTRNHRTMNIQKRSKGHLKSKSKMYSHRKQSEEKNYHLLLVLAVICIIPMIVRLKIYEHNMELFSWFANSKYHFDLFLYYKQWILITVSAFMAAIIIYKGFIDRKRLTFLPVFAPLAAYGLLALLSAVFSKYSSFSFGGGFEQFESVFALLGYCIIVYYSYLFVKTERDFKIIITFMIAVGIIMSLLGVFQYLGKDFFASDTAYNLIIPREHRNGSELTMNFEEGRVYMTLFNPNYVGVYVTLFAPVIMAMLFFQKNIVLIILSVFSVIGLAICLLGSKSLSGFMGMGVAMLCIPIFMWRTLIKRFYITIPVMLFIILGLFTLNSKTDNFFVNKLITSLKTSKVVYSLTDMETMNDHIKLTYKGNNLQARYLPKDDQTLPYLLLDDNGQEVIGTFDTSNKLYVVNDERFEGIILGMDPELEGVFYIQVEGLQYRFTNWTEDGTYYYMNRFNRIDKMKTASSAVFDGYESLASGRGYIWSRTIPLIKKYVFLGSGPDTFAMAFPQQDYANMMQAGFGTEVLTKPHNLYLQIAIQTGLLSLIAFLAFYGIYFIQSIRLYFRGRFSSGYAKVGVAIFISTLAYMVTGLTNDSSITTAPIFWTFMGLGIVANQKAKPLIQEELATLKASKRQELSEIIKD